jgi:hypothetical protein
MIEVKDSCTSPAEKHSELALPFDEWQRAEILSVQVQKIKRNEDARRFSKEKVFKDGAAFSVDTSNLAIEHGLFDLQMLSDPGRCDSIHIADAAKGQITSNRGGTTARMRGRACQVSISCHPVTGLTNFCVFL